MKCFSKIYYLSLLFALAYSSFMSLEKAITCITLHQVVLGSVTNETNISLIDGPVRPSEHMHTVGVTNTSGEYSAFDHIRNFSPALDQVTSASGGTTLNSTKASFINSSTNTPVGNSSESESIADIEQSVSTLPELNLRDVSFSMSNFTQERSSANTSLHSTVSPLSLANETAEHKNRNNNTLAYSPFLYNQEEQPHSILSPGVKDFVVLTMKPSATHQLPSQIKYAELHERVPRAPDWMQEKIHISTDNESEYNSNFTCFPPSKTDNKNRKFYWENDPAAVSILVSQRPEATLLAWLLRLVLRDYLGYRMTRLVAIRDRFNINDSVDHISCYRNRVDPSTGEVRLVHEKPVAVLQMDLLGPPQLHLSKVVSRDRHVMLLGNTGPRLRLGWFMSRNANRKKCSAEKERSDYWRLLQYPSTLRSYNYTPQEIQQLLPYALSFDQMSGYCEGLYCHSGMYVPPWCNARYCAVLLASYPEGLQALYGLIKRFKLSVQVVFVGEHLADLVRHRAQQSRPVMFIHFTPSLLLMDGVFDEMAFPGCLRANCADMKELYMHKMMWDQLKSTGDLLYQIISLFQVTQQDFEDLLMTQLENRHLSQEQVACRWLTEHPDRWQDRWIPVDRSENVIQIGGIFPIGERQLNSGGILTATRMAIEAINANTSLLADFWLDMRLGDGRCSSDMVMKNFIRFVQSSVFNNMAGIVGPACSNAIESLAGVAGDYRTMVISYSAEGAVVSNRTKYPYFFRTIGENKQFRYVYKQLFQKMGWKRCGALTQQGQKYSEYMASVEELLEISGVKVLFNRRIDLQNKDLAGFMVSIKERDIRILIGDLYESEMREVICEAYRTGLTADQGFVWFIPTWFTKNWYKVDAENADIPCTTDNMMKALDGHLALSHSYFANDSDIMQEGISVQQWRRYYARNCSDLPQFVLNEKWLMQNDGSTDTEEIVLPSYPFEQSNYAGYAYDAVWTYGLALNKLLSEKRTHYRDFHRPETAKRFFEIINKTDFHGVSGLIRFNGPSRLSITDVSQWRDNQLIHVGHFIPDPSSPEGGTLYLDESKIHWRTPDGQRPKDGLLFDCEFHHLALLFDITCASAKVTVNVLSLSCGVFIVCFAALLIKRRYALKMRRLRELGLVNVSSFNLDEWELARESVVLNRKLGEGAFGTVYGGEVQMSVSNGAQSGPPNERRQTLAESGGEMSAASTSSCQRLVAVAVKTLNRDSSLEERLDFLAETDVMKKLQHNNIVRLLGVCTRSEPILSVMEFMLYGDLKTFLLARRTLVSAPGGREGPESSTEVSSTTLTAMARDVAAALTYLASLNYVHRDIACRNCLVGARYIVKLGDFGMTRSLCDSDYYRFNRKGKLPVRWMAPESLRDGRFTPKSDMWSFGVLLYEIVTFGGLPYPGQSNTQVVQLVRAGYNAGVPDAVKPELAELMRQCWSVDETARPDSSAIVQTLTVQYPRLLTPCLSVALSSSVLHSFHIADTQSLPHSPSRHRHTAAAANNNHLNDVRHIWRDPNEIIESS